MGLPLSVEGLGSSREALPNISEGWESADAPSSVPIDLRGKTILAIFNPAARNGRIRHEMPDLRRVLESSGARVILVETDPDKGIRRGRIRAAAREAFQHLQNNERLFVLPVGGDGTFWETAGETLKGIGVDYTRIDFDPAQYRHLVARAPFPFIRKGTAEDNAAQNGAPGRIGAMPRYLMGAVELPCWFPTIETMESPGEVEIAGHNFGVGVSGFLFALRAGRVAENPQGFWNQGVKSFLIRMPHALFSRYGLLGFDVEMTHFDAAGNEIKRVNPGDIRASEVIVSPNRLIAGVGGVPGAWGETKIIILPPGLYGVAAIAEFMGRGIATKLGLNRVGPNSSMRFLSADRQWLIRPGERVDVRFRVPKSFPLSAGWDFLREAFETGFFYRRWRPTEPVPPAGELLPVPSQLNGDVARSTTGMTIRNPGLPITTEAHPNSFGVRLARSSALVDGTVPPLSDQEVTSFLPDHHGGILERGPAGTRVRTPFISQPRLFQLLGEHGLPMDHGLAMLLAHQHVDVTRDLLSMASPRVNLEAARVYLNGNQGEAWAASRRSSARAFGERALTQGFPLGIGILGMWGGETLMDRIGLDPHRDRALRFSLVTYLTHAVQANVAPFWEVASNRMLGRPYDFVRLREARAAGEVMTQYTLSRTSSLSRALGESWLTGAVELSSGGMSLGAQFGRGALLPFRAAWNMGEGLLFSRMVESLVSGLPEDSAIRHYAPLGAFFIPDVMRIAAPRVAFNLFHARSFGIFARVTAAGFMLDLGFSGIHRLAYGVRATYESSLDERVSRERRVRGDTGLMGWRRAVHFLAPSLGAYIDSHHYGFGESNSLRREMARQDAEISQAVQAGIDGELAHLEGILGGSGTALLNEPVRLTSREALMAVQIERCRGGELLREDADFTETAAYLLDQYSGVLSNQAEAERALARIRLCDLQRTLQFLSGIEMPETQWVRGYFTSSAMNVST